MAKDERDRHAAAATRNLKSGIDVPGSVNPKTTF
jgi:hypothetical protein